jgi:hypothetical protein
MKKHEHKKADYCTCYPLGIEPDDTCPVHGIPDYPTRCVVCGQFMKVDVE